MVAARGRWDGRGMRNLTLGLVLAAALAGCAPEQAAAYETFTTSSCSALTWTAQPRVVVHTDELPTGSAYFGDELKLLAAVNDVNDAFNDVNATAAQITSTTTSTAPFTQEVWFNDATPTIHVGFHDDPEGKLGSGGPGPSVNCRYDEAHIGFKNLDFNAPSDTWNFNTPAQDGKPYYDMTQNDADGDRYFRLAYLHELLHTFGLSHSDSSYSMLNYGDRPWSDEDTIRPLPDDVAALRALYPQPNVGASEVAVFNTFYTLMDGTENGAARQNRLCAPSLGDFFWSDEFAAYCGVEGPDASSTEVCQGDLLRTRFTIGNYSTQTAELTARLWLSRDEQWDPTDLVSPSRIEYDVESTHAHRESASWEVPALGFAAADYHPILRVRGTTPDGRSVEAWTPLRGRVHHVMANCLTAEESDLPIGPHTL